MDLQGLLGSSFDCKCGRRHHVPIQSFVYEPDVIEILGDIIVDCLKPRTAQNIVVVADIRTWKVCGKKVYSSLEQSGLKVKKIIVPDTENCGPTCDDKTVEWLKDRVSGQMPNLLVAVGSGVINDLCKWSSFELGMPYIVVATAASMNGYAAANVAAKVGRVKILIEAKPPLAVVAEPAVIENAPREMTAAGFGDTIAKFQSNMDWSLNNFLLDEYYCGYCVKILTDLESLYLGQGKNIKANQSRAVKGLFEALFWTGVVMTMVGTSAPASGGEHLLSHTLDMIADIHCQRHELHGRQVGLGVIFSAELYNRILKIDRPMFVEVPKDIDKDFWTDPAVAKAVREQYLAKRPQLEIMREKIAQQKVWSQLKAKLRSAVRNPGQIKDWLQRAGAASSIAEIDCSRERIRAAVMHMHEIRSRCTVVDLAWSLGVLPTAVDEIIEEWLIS